MQAVTLIEKMKADFALSFRQIIADVDFSYPSFMRWRQRVAAGKPPVQRPGPRRLPPSISGI